MNSIEESIKPSATLNLANTLATAMESVAKIARLQQEHIYNQIATGGSVIAKVAKQYHKNGIAGGDSDVFKPVKATKASCNPKNVGRKYTRPRYAPQQYFCSRCGKPHVDTKLANVCSCSRRELAVYELARKG